MSKPTNVPSPEILIRIELLEKKLTTFGDHLFRLSESVMNLDQEHSDRFREAFDRIKNLELAVFPDLLTDLESLHKVIGGTGVPAKNNPYDRRDFSSKNIEDKD